MNNVLEIPITADDKWKVWDGDNYKVGMFQLPRQLLEDKPAIVATIMAHCIITKADCIFHTNIMEYVAFSPEFDWVAEGEMPYIYEWEITEVRALDEGPVIDYTAVPKRYDDRIGTA